MKKTSVPQAAFLKTFKKTYLTTASLDRRLTITIKSLARCCGFRSIIHEGDFEKCVNIGIAGILKNDKDQVTAGEFLVTLILLGIALFAKTRGFESIPANTRDRLEEIFQHIEKTTVFSCAEALFYTAVDKALIATEDEQALAAIGA